MKVIKRAPPQQRNNTLLRCGRSRRQIRAVPSANQTRCVASDGGADRAVNAFVRGCRAALSEGSRRSFASWSELMLRILFLQHWFNLADESCEEALLDSTALRRFVEIDLGRECVPDGTTLSKFRRLLARNLFGEQLFANLGEVLQGRGEDWHRHDRGCHHYQGAKFHEECGQGARARNASDEKRPAVVLRHEAAHRRG